MSSQNYLSVYAKSFSWAGFFLPKKTFKKCSDLYDFCAIRKISVSAILKTSLRSIKRYQNYKNPINIDTCNASKTFM